MKNLKTLFSSLLFVFSICLFSQAQAADPTLPVYQNAISSITLGYEGKLLGGTITLDNGLVMNIADYSKRDDNVMKTWHAGDVLVFKPYRKHDTLLLAATRVNGPYADKVEPYLIFDMTRSPQAGLIISEVRDDGHYVKLNDNSVWNFSFLNRFTTKHWQPGQRVLVSGKGDSDSYEFINLDAPVEEKVYRATGTFAVH